MTRAERTPLPPITRTRPARDYRQAAFWAEQDYARAAGFRRVSRYHAAGGGIRGAR